MVESGPGISFWFRPSTAALAEVPLDDREQALQFTARTSDVQTVSVQATVTYRVAVAATRIDFGIHPHTGEWNARPLERLVGLLAELAQQPALDYLSGVGVTDALAHGIGPVRQRVTVEFADDRRLVERGLAVTDVRVVAIRAEADLDCDIGRHPATVVTGVEVAAVHRPGQLGCQAAAVGQESGGDTARVGYHTDTISSARQACRPRRSLHLPSAFAGRPGTLDKSQSKSRSFLLRGHVGVSTRCSQRRVVEDPG